MVSHASDMNDLVSAIMILDYPFIADRAEKIASDVSLSRPVTGDATELNASMTPHTVPSNPMNGAPETIEARKIMLDS